MIVKCEQCQTRFKIPDDKVTEKGVKVRCTKCQHTFRVKRDGTSSPAGQSQGAMPALQVASVPKLVDDPFAAFGAASEEDVGEATRPGMYAMGVEASRHAEPPLQPSFAAQRALPAHLFDEPTRVGAFPFPPPGRKGVPDEVTHRSSPFDFAAALGAAEPSAPPPPFDFAAPPVPEPPTQYEAPAARAQPPVPFDPSPDNDPFNSIDFGGGALTTPNAPIVKEPEAPSVFGDGGGDFFAAAEEPSVTQNIRPDSLGLSEEGEVEADTSQRAALFDMPPPEPNRPPETFDSPSPEVGPAPLALPRRDSVPLGRITAPELSVEAIAPRRKLGGMILNVAIASMLVSLLTVIVTVYLSEGKVELASFNLERLKATFTAPTDWAALDISNGLYETRAGRPVFFVRGEVKNRSGKATRAKVRAEILDGDKVIRHADAWIGAAPTPEDLYLISVADDVERLLQKLEKSAAEVMPNEKRGFLVPFFEYPPDLKGFRVRVTVIESDHKETAAR